MRRIEIHIALMAGAALMLAGCGFADVRSPVPEFMRAKAPEPPALEPAPDVKRMLKEKLDAVFTAASQPTACSRFRAAPQPARTGLDRLRQGRSGFGDRQTAGHADLSCRDFRRRDRRSPKGRGRGHLQCRELRAGLAATGSASSPAPDKASAHSSPRTAGVHCAQNCPARDS